MQPIRQWSPGGWSPTVLAGPVAALLALAAYLPTVAPTISWRNGGADGGDLAAAVVTLGVPHPPGYPTYVLLGWLWAMLPLGGDPAYRLNLLSAAGAVGAVGFCVATGALLGRRIGLAPGPSAVGGALGGLALALAPLTWSQATIAEVYAPGLAVLGALTLVLLTRRRGAQARLLPLAGLLGGLGLGVLPQLVLVAPGALGLLVDRFGRRGLASRLGPTLAAGGGGLIVFAYLPLRAATDPIANWGDPTTVARFWAVVSAESYQNVFGSVGPAQWFGRLLDSAVVLGHNLGWLGVGLAGYGAGALWRRCRGELAYVSSLIVLTILFRVGYPAEGNVVYLLPALYCLALLAGIGTARALARSRRFGGGVAAVGLGLGLGVLLLGRAFIMAPALDVSGDTGADAFGRRVLTAVPLDALVVSEHDETTFSLWYRQSLGERTDVVVIDSRLLTHEWYRATLVRRYSDLNPAAVRPGGLTALARPVYVLVGSPTDATLHLVERRADMPMEPTAASILARPESLADARTRAAPGHITSWENAE